MNPHKCIILFLLLSSLVINAQTDFRDGYVILNSKDSIHGKIDYQSDFKMSKICKFKNLQGVIYEYRPNELCSSPLS